MAKEEIRVSVGILRTKRALAGFEDGGATREGVWLSLKNREWPLLTDSKRMGTSDSHRKMNPVDN